MSVDPSRLSGLRRAFGLLVVAIGGPAAALVVWPDLMAMPWLATLSLLAYELGVVIVGFAAAVWRDLRHLWATRTVEAVDAWVRRHTSAFTSRYLRYVAAATRYLDVKGLSTQGEYTLEMRDVLVRLALAPKPVHTLSADPVGPRDTAFPSSGEESIWHWLRQAQRARAVLAIVGPPGSGKTTLLRYVAQTLAKGGRRFISVDAPSKIPVIVNLREHKDWPAGEAVSMATIVRRSLAALERPQPPGWIEAHLRRGNFLIMLDGLDEMPNADVRRALTSWLEQQLSGQPGNLLVVTSRPFGYRDSPVVGAVVVEVQPFAEAQVDTFVRQWYQAIAARSHGGYNDSSRLAAQAGATDLLARLDETPRIADLTTNPLLLTMIANVHHYRGALPGSRSELYQEISEVFLGKRHQARGVPVDLPSRQKQSVLRALAYEMMIRQVSDVNVADACDWIKEPLARVSDRHTPVEFLRGVEDSSGLLVEKERDTFAFAHLTFQEYLAADYIRDQGKVAELLDDVGSSWWRETILLYAATADATPIVESCLARASEPAIVALAVECVEQAREVTIEMRQLLDRVVNPPDVRSNSSARQTAAHIRLLLRRNRDMALDRGRLMSRTPVTCLEYQRFLEASGEDRVPDHWVGGIFPPGMENAPVVGVRRDDAEAFCAWLKSETGSAEEFRLPRADEIDTARQREGWNADHEQLRYWTNTYQPVEWDAGFSRLLRNASEGQRREPYPPTAAPIETSYLKRLLVSEAAWLRHGSARAVIELVRRAWSATASCDAGQLERHIVLAAQMVTHYTDAHPLGGREAAFRQVALGEHAQSLVRMFSAAIRRPTPEPRSDAGRARDRRAARANALSAAYQALMLYMAHNRGAELQAPGWLPRPTRKVPQPSLLPSVMTNALAHGFIGIYADLARLEARITNAHQPVEGIVYVREIQQSRARPSLVHPTALRRWTASRRLVKALFDRTIAAALLVLLAPTLLAIAIGVKVDSAGPVLFRQRRIGRDSQEFTMYKFRTMHPDAEARLMGMLHLNQHDGALFKMRNDPRVTRTGRFLRRWSLDELPQLFNVLNGTMSLVGPRPPLPEEVAGYSDELLGRLLVQPGMTGLWQVSGRSDLSWQDGIRLDLEYIENWSPMLDVIILARTIGAVVRGTGAY